MNKAQLIEEIALQTGETKASTGRALEATIEVISRALQEGRNVTLVGFGTFKVTERASRKGVHPRTTAAIRIPASKVPRFVAGARLKDLVGSK